MKIRSLIIRPAGIALGILGAFGLLNAHSAHGAGTFVESEVTVRYTLSSLGGSFGWAVSGLTDISNPPDGITDIIVPSLGEAKVYVYSGADGSLLLTLPKPAADQPNGTFGNAVSDAGDVNGDAVSDIVVGSPGSTTFGTNPGRAFVFSGADGALLLTLTGEVARDAFGAGVGGAGDVNSDGRADILVGASNNDASGADSGRAYVFSGADGALIRTLNAEAAGDSFGSGAAGTGDVNGDSIGDQIVGAPFAGAFGRAYVFSGADGTLLFATNADAGGAQYGVFFVAGVGDVDSDGNRDVYVGDYAANGGQGRAYVYSGIDGALIHSFSGGAGDGVGPGRGAGDVNNDGHADLLVGHWTSSQGAAGAGRTVVYSGADGSILRTITSTTAGENFGFDAVGVGDTNEDGFIDLLVSAATQNRVYLISGIEHAAPLPDPPLADPTGVSKSRFLSFLLPSASTAAAGQSALRVTLESLHHVVPPYTGGPSVPFTAFEGQVRWVGPAAQYVESTSAAIPFFASSLQCTPHYQDWSTVGLLHVTGSAVVPSSTYRVEVLAASCMGNENGCMAVSEGLPVTTTRWADVETPYNPPSATAQPDLGDVSALVNKFRSVSGAPIKARALLAGIDQFGNMDPAPDLSFAHIASCVDAFRGLPYPYVISECP